jgi:hypothetical protein
MSHPRFPTPITTSNQRRVRPSDDGVVVATSVTIWPEAPVLRLASRVIVIRMKRGGEYGAGWLAPETISECRRRPMVVTSGGPCLCR